MAPLLVLLQGALLFIAPAAVVTLVGLAHRGRGDCVGERRGSTGVTSPCALALQNRPGANVHGRCSVEFFCLSSFPQLQLQTRTDDQTLERRDNGQLWEERGDPGHIALDCWWASRWPNCCSKEGRTQGLCRGSSLAGRLSPPQDLRVWGPDCGLTFPCGRRV